MMTCILRRSIFYTLLAGCFMVLLCLLDRTYCLKNEKKEVLPKLKRGFESLVQNVRYQQPDLEDLNWTEEFSASEPKSRQKREINSDNRIYFFIGGAVLIVVAILILLCCICKCRKKKKNKSDKKLKKAVKKSTRTNSQTKVPSPDPNAPPMEMRVDALPLPVQIPETSNHDKPVAEVEVHDGDVQSVEGPSEYQNQNLNLTQASVTNIALSAAAEVPGPSSGKAASHQVNNEAIDPKVVERIGSYSSERDERLKTYKDMPNGHENQPHEEVSIQNLHSQAVQVLPPVFTAPVISPKNRPEANTDRELKPLNKTDSRSYKDQSYNSNVGNTASPYMNQPSSIVGHPDSHSSYDQERDLPPKGLDHKDNDIEQKISSIESTMITIESNLNKLKDLTKNIEQDLHHEPGELSPHPDDNQSYNKSYVPALGLEREPRYEHPNRQSEKPEIPTKRFSDYSDSTYSREYISPEAVFKSQAASHTNYDRHKFSDEVAYSDDSGSYRNRNRQFGSSDSESRYSSMERQHYKPKVPLKRRDLRQSVDSYNLENYSPSERNPRIYPVHEKYSEPIKKRDSLERGHSYSVQDKRYREPYPEDIIYKPKLPKKSSSYTEKSGRNETRMHQRPLSTSDSITEEGFDVDIPPPVSRKIPKTTGQKKYQKKEEENIPIPDPDYSQQRRESAFTEGYEDAEEVIKPPIKPKPAVKPREFKGPYGLEDLDDMNNPLTIAMRFRQRRMPLSP